MDTSSGSAITTTYANDMVGLSQVLLADDGTTQTATFFGLDLIGQDNGSETRLLLADGLGSERVEMVGSDMEATMTHAPFGEVLAQAGNSGTSYGFTCEQFDGSSSLLYLRARYYNSALHTFMSKDPWSGNNLRPQSMNGWSYVDNNPINLTDPLGLFPDYCHHVGSFAEYEYCVREYYNVDGPLHILIQSQKIFHPLSLKIGAIMVLYLIKDGGI